MKHSDESISKLNFGNQIKFAALLVIIFSGVVCILLGGWLTGVSTDEPTHVARLNSFFKFGWYLPGGYLEQGQPKSTVIDVFVYGPITAIFAHAMAVLLGAEQWGIASYSAEAYAARHIGVGLLSFISIGAVAGLGRLIIGSWMWGLISAAMLASLPLWIGHAMFNIKDIPVASGYTLYILALLLFFKAVLKNQGALIRTRYIFLASLGLVLSIGTRPGIWPLMVASALAGGGVYVYCNLNRKSLKQDIRFFIKSMSWIALPFVICFLVLLLIYPNAFRNMADALYDSAFRSARYDVWKGVSLSNGYFHSQPPPIWYWPAWLSHQTPIAVFTLWLVGLSIAVCTSLRLLRNNSLEITEQIRVIGLVMVLVQSLCGPLMSILLKSTVYDGTRQFMFIYPALSILGALGLFELYKLMNKLIQKKIFLLLTNIVVFVFIFLSPVVDQWRLFPYVYVYMNEVATLRGVNGKWPTDYWRTSLRALINKTEGNFVIDCRGMAPPPKLNITPLTVPDIWVRQFPSDLKEGCGNTSGDPYLKNIQASNNLKPNEQYFLLGINRFGVRLPQNCKLIHEETRILRGEKIIMGWVGLCSRLN